MKYTVWTGGVIIIAAACWGGTPGGLGMVERYAQWTLPQAATNNLEVRTPTGDIRVVTVEGNRLEVRARKAVRGGSQAEGETLLEEIKVEPRRTPGGWLAAASWPERLQGRGISPQVDFVAQVPRTVRLDLTTADGTLEIEDQTHSEVDLAIDHPSGSVPAELSAGHGATRMRLDAGTSLHLHLRSPIRIRTRAGAVRLRSEG